MTWSHFLSLPSLFTVSFIEIKEIYFENIELELVYIVEKLALGSIIDEVELIRCFGSEWRFH